MISDDVVILTKSELEDFKNKWFQKGVDRGRFEEACGRLSLRPYAEWLLNAFRHKSADLPAHMASDLEEALSNHK